MSESGSFGRPDPRDRSDLGLATMSGVWRRLFASAVVVALISIGVGVVTYLTRAIEPATYESVARFSITPNDELLLNGTPADLVDTVAALDRPIVNATVSELLQSGSVAEDAARTIGIDDEVLDDYDFDASEVPGAAIVRLSITGPDADTVTDLTRAVRDTRLETAREFVGVFDVRSIDRSVVRVAKIAPNPTRDALAAALASAIALGALAILLDNRRHPARANRSTQESDAATSSSAGAA